MAKYNGPDTIDGLPVIPVGLDVYRMRDRLPYHRIGIRAYTRSTHDPPDVGALGL